MFFNHARNHCWNICTTTCKYVLTGTLNEQKYILLLFAMIIFNNFCCNTQTIILEFQRITRRKRMSVGFRLNPSPSVRRVVGTCLTSWQISRQESLIRYHPLETRFGDLLKNLIFCPGTNMHLATNFKVKLSQVFLPVQYCCILFFYCQKGYRRYIYVEINFITR